ncbi:MAG: amidophosphoribosyltransferase [Candidatus Omnitrophica bacterium]|nr:amidophosphoribosyltransferase [Candidatus Omnitrophota bacterium]
MSGEGIKENCGVFGVWNHPDAARLVYLGLYALQHRGEESAGIVSTDGEKLFIHKGLGLVSDVFKTDEDLKPLVGRAAIGHVRYSTTGSTLLKNAQPLLFDYSHGKVAIGHNGNITNAKRLRDELEAYGAIFQTTTDSEIIIHLMAKPSYRNRLEGLTQALERVEGAYTLVLLTESEMIGVRDPLGFRPLVLGRVGKSHVLASETCALDLIEAEFVREIEPGEVVVINDKGIESRYPFGRSQEGPQAFCLFEHIYFSRPDSRVFGKTVLIVRERLGEELAREHPVEADVVIPIPDSGNSAALGFSRVSGIPVQDGVIRNHYVGRTFIQPSQLVRDLKVKIKLNPVREVLEGRRVVVVDDSIVRGTTCKQRIQSLRKAGAKEIHMRVSCPPHKNPCYYGIDFPDRAQLLAANKNLDEIRKFLDADSIGYLSIEGALRAAGHPPSKYCTACWTGKYPTTIREGVDKFSMEILRTL